MPTFQDLSNAIRFLSIDAVNKANSGHPGMPMGMADIATVLWIQFLNYHPSNPHWINRDRFVLSNGHGSLLLYSALHLSGYDLSIEEIKRFRQHHSKTPGHPEVHETPGVETTTGPLGQGLANAVGMAIAEARLAETFNKPDHKIIDHYTYVFLGDGCLMEGISHEACSLAGTLKLGKLIAFWDDNGISIDGKISGWFADNTPERFRAYHWHVIDNIDGHNPEAIAKAIREAQSVTDKPSLLCCKTIIGFGSPAVAGTAKAHGSPLEPADIAATREALHWPHAPFHIPTEIYQAWNGVKKGEQLEKAWQLLFQSYEKQYPTEARELLRRMKGELPAHFSAADFIATLNTTPTKEATRKSSLQCLEQYTKELPELLGGSADLSGSNGTKIKNAVVYQTATKTGNYLHYGVREFGMSAIMNGIALHGGFIPFGGTFLVFSDYARNAVRLSALMKQKVIYVYTHDSIGLGEDGPTHQPISQAASLRLIPGLAVWRPADRVETAVAWESSLKAQHPSCLLLTRQDVQQTKRSIQQLSEIARGGYILIDAEHPQAILIATGSEVELAVSAHQALLAEGIAVRVVSMPCTSVFDAQDAHYRETVFPPHLTARVAIEAGSPDTWYKYVGMAGDIIAINQFGFSAPYEEIYEAMGLTVTNIKRCVLNLLQRRRK